MAIQKLKICHVITGLGCGGAERSLFNHILDLNTQYYDTIIISLQNRMFYDSKLESRNIYVLNLDFHGFISTIKSCASLLSTLNSFDPDILVGWMYHGSLAATFASIFFPFNRIRLIWNIRQSLDDKSSLSFKTHIIVRILGWFSSTPYAIIHNSRKSIQDHKKLGIDSSNTIYIPNGCDVSFFASNPVAAKQFKSRFQIPDNAIIYGFAGRLSHQKNVHFLVANFLHFLSLCDRPAYLVCVGKDIPDLESLYPSNYIIYLDNQDNIADFYSAIDILCLPSLWEGSPNVVIEAMACSTPCIVSDVGDSARLVGQYGWAFQSNNHTELINLLLRTSELSQAELAKYGSMARSHIELSFNHRQTLLKYIDLYQAS